MLISVQELKKVPDQPVEFNFATSAEELDLAEEGIRSVDPVTVCLRATCHNGIVLLQGKMRTTVVLECSRCLHRFIAPLETDFEEEAPVDDLQTLDLSDMLREHYFAMFPAKPLCRLSCKGLCAMCGVNKNDEQCDCQPEPEDHRLSILKKLLF
jgi:uncharacterized protein